MKKIFYLLIAVLFVFTSNTTFAGDGDKWDTVTGTTKTGEDRYIESASTNGAKTNLNYSQSSNPGKVYIDTQSSFTVYNNSTFNLSVQTTDAMKWCHAIVFFDWNGDGTFEVQSEKIGYDSSDSNTGDLSSTGNTIVNNFNIDISVPGDATIGETRMRIQFTDAWHKKNTPNHQHSATDEIDQGGCYDFIMNIEARPTRTVTVMAGENGSATITAPAGAENGSITTSEAVEISATANSGYIFNNWTDKAGNIITANPYTYSGGENIVLTAHFSKSSYQVTYIKENFDFDHVNLKNRYLESITIGDKTKEFTVKPSNVWTVLSDMTVNAAVGETVNTHMIAKNMGDYNTDTQIPDLRYTAVYLAADWDGDGVFEDLQKIKGNTPPKNNVGGNADQSDVEGYVMDFTYNITIPDNAVPGKTARVRLNYTNAWVSNYTNGNIDILKTSCKEGIVYDFDIVIQSPETTRTVTVKANPAEGGSVKITSPENITENTVDTPEPVTVLAEAKPGYRFINWTNGDGTSVAATPEYTYRGINDVELTANFEKTVNRTIKTIKGTLADPGFAAGYIVRGNIPIDIIDGANSITMAAWVNIEGPSSNSIDQGSVAWGDAENMGKVVIGTRQNNLTGYGSEPAFAINVCGIDNTKDVYKLGLFAKGGAKNISGVEMPKGWFHLAFTLNYDNTNTTIKMFVNGIEKAEASKSGNFERFDDLCVGDNMNAEFDDIMIWNTALDANAIAASMKGYTDEEIKGQTNLIGYYTCDDLTDDNAISNNLVTDYSEFTLRRDKMSYAATNQKWATPCTKSDYTGTGVTVLSERQTPRGGENFYLNKEEITAENWEKNGNENFGYLVNSPELTHLAYNGVDKVALDNDVLAVYHNGNPALPTFVKQSDIITNAELEVPQIQSSYVAAGLEYTITMPSVAKQWMPISLPGQVDLVAGPTSSDDNTLVGLRPGWNFWYSTFNSKYADETNYSDIWSDIEKDTDEETSKVYLLDAGIISVPDSRKGQQFTFYTEYNTPVVMRAWNDQFNSTLMPEPGKLGLVKNPYSFKVTVTDIAKQIGANMTVYVYNPKSGNFDIPQEGTQFIVDRFVPFFVFNENGTTQKAPRYIGTKDVSGVLEVEAVYDVNVSGTQGAIEIKTFVPTEIEIFTINGTLVAASEVNGTHSFTLEAGIYIVRTIVEGNAKTFKVIVE